MIFSGSWKSFSRSFLISECKALVSRYFRKWFQTDIFVLWSPPLASIAVYEHQYTNVPCTNFIVWLVHLLPRLSTLPALALRQHSEEQQNINFQPLQFEVVALLLTKFFIFLLLHFHCIVIEGVISDGRDIHKDESYRSVLSLLYIAASKRATKGPTNNKTPHRAHHTILDT